MRRLLRILLNGLTILSLLLALTFAALRVRGYWRSDDFGWTPSRRSTAQSYYFGLTSARGGVTIYVYRYWPSVVADTLPAGWHWNSYGEPLIPFASEIPANRWGLGYESFRDPAGHWRWIIFPAWLATTVFALLPATRLALAVRRRRRAREGLCKKCGYDLRATPDRCPECGTLAPAAARAARACDALATSIRRLRSRHEGH